MSFHAFPKTGEKRGRHFSCRHADKQFEVSPHSTICSLHFTPDDFKKLTNITKLKFIATPSIFLRSASQKKPSQVIVIFLLRNVNRRPRKLHVVQVHTNEFFDHVLFKKLIHQKNFKVLKFWYF